MITFQNHEIYYSWKTEFYENNNTVTFYLCKTSSFHDKFSHAEIDPSTHLSGMLAKMPAAELCVLTFSFLCWVFSRVPGNITSKTELGLSNSEHIKSNSQCSAKCISLLIRKLMNFHSLEEYMCAFYWLMETIRLF